MRIQSLGRLHNFALLSALGCAAVFGAWSAAGRANVVPLVLRGAARLVHATTHTPANVDVSNQSGPQVEAAVAASQVTAGSLVAGAITATVTGSTFTPRIYAYNSRDDGNTWQGQELEQSPAAARCNRRYGSSSGAVDPSVAARFDGAYFFGYMDVCAQAAHGDEVVVRSSTDGGRTWSATHTVYSLIGSTILLADYPKIYVDNGSKSPTKGRIYMTWNEWFDTNFTQPNVELSWSDDNALTWHKPVQVNVQLGDNGAWQDLVVGGDGRVYVVWDEYRLHASGHPGLIQLAASSNTPSSGYAPTFTSHTNIAVTGVGSIRPCFTNFCIPAQSNHGISPLPSLLADSSDKLYALWTQGHAGSAVTDVEVQTSTDHGATWSQPVQVNDDNVPGNFSSGASDFFPAGVIDPRDNSLHVSFYSTRLDSTNRTTNVYVAISTDGGISFSTNDRITNVASNESVSNKSRDILNYGDYEGIAIQGSKEHLVWTDTRRSSTLQEEIFTARR